MCCINLIILPIGGVELTFVLFRIQGVDYISSQPEKLGDNILKMV